LCAGQARARAGHASGDHGGAEPIDPLTDRNWNEPIEELLAKTIRSPLDELMS
jgi:hypothetical protein